MSPGEPKAREEFEKAEDQIVEIACEQLRRETSQQVSSPARTKPQLARSREKGGAM